jgi:amino acid adenylation domain-containing protein
VSEAEAPAAAPPARSSRQLLLQRLKERKESRLGTAQAIPRLGATTAEASFGQQRLWFLEQLEPGNPRFNILTALRLRGRLDAAALAGSLDAMVRRHEVLRTTFVAEGGRPLQVVAESPAAGLVAGLVTIDLAGAPDPDRLLPRLFTAEAHRPFDLARGPLLRGLLLRLRPEEHVLLLAMHQITVDRWSRGLSVRELTALYAAAVTGRPAGLPELSIQYADYAVWQRRHLRGEVLEGLLAYWREQLAGAPPSLELPFDRPRPAVQTSRGGNVYAVVARPLLERLQALGQRAGATLFMVLLAGLAALLTRLTGEEDMVVGSPIANRRNPQIEPLIGFFLNMLALRLRTGGNPGFRALVARVRETALGAYAHQDLPFERLVEELGVGRDLSRHPLFQTTLVLQNAPMPPLSLPGLTAGLLDVDWGTTAFDLGLFFWETALWERLEEGLSLIANYNADLFDATTIRRWVEQLDRLLQEAAAEPERPLGDLSLLSAAERHQALAEWSGEAAGAAGGPWEVCLHRRFERQADARPDAVALEDAGGALTYGELDRRADRLARRLLRRGLAPEPVVALCLEPSAELVVAIVATLKAGGAYLPLAPDLPAERLALLLSDARAALVVTRQALLPCLPAASPPVLCWEEISGGEQEGTERPPGEEAGPAALAYVLFTSGSTGRPKAVGVPHRAVARLVLGDLGVEPGDRVARAATPSFDAFTYELWAPLLHGACSVGLGREVVLSPHRLAAELARRRVDDLFLPTALFERLAAEAPAAFAGLRRLLFGGETVSPARVRAVLAAGPPERLLHVYGPTEATTFSSSFVVRAAAGPAAVPVGRPLAGTALHVLARDAAPAGIGIEGELHLAGAGLARGYLECPAATAAAFVPHPSSGEPGARLYRTGDRARFLADGNLELRGRRDQQVKIRGFRVESEEVRAALARHPAVAEAAVVAHEPQPGDRRLVGYAVARQGAEAPTGPELAAFLRERLPPYMVPAAVVILAALPRTAGGKLDAAALPIPSRDEVAGSGAFVAPATAAEERLAALWGEVLGRERIGAHDDFFALGGHSLHAVQALARIRRAFGVDLAVRALYETPTLAGLARAVAAAPPAPPAESPPFRQRKEGSR